MGPIAYADPWTQPVEDRVRALLRPGARRRVAYVYEIPDATTFRYRVWNMVQALAGAEDVAASWFTRAESERLLPLLEHCDALVICRARYCERIAHLLSRAESLGITTVFDCDDLVFDAGCVHLVLRTLDQPLSERAWDTWFATIGRIGATLRLCRRVIVTNDFLARMVRRAAPGKDVRVVPNFLNHMQLSVSAALFAARRPMRDGRIPIGYFSGTPTHARDFAIAAPALADILRRERRAVLRLVGFVPPHPALAAFSDRIEVVTLQDFLNLQRLIAGCALNLVPLQDNDFTNSKSELKYFEAAAVGTVTLASPTHVYRAAISDGANGYLVPAYAWRDKLQTAIASVAESGAMAARAHDDVLARYSPAAMLPAIRAALFAPPPAASASAARTEAG